MSVLDVLAGEHVLFRRLIGDLQRVLRFEEDAARREARDVLLVLLPALERHQELEDLVFGPAAEGSRVHAKVVAELNKEHWRIALLRAELLEAMKESGAMSCEAFRKKTLELVVKLRMHFEMEETRLWGRLRELSGRGIDKSIERRAREQLRKLLRESERRRELTSELEGGVP